LDYTIFRFFNTYGPNQSDDFVIPRFLKQSLNNEDITIYGDGSQTRTFCYVDDNIDACLNAHYKQEFVNQTVNIGSDDERSILNLAQTIIKSTNSSSSIIHLPALEEGDMTRRKPDNAKMKSLLNRSLTTLEEGIVKMQKHYENRG
jgi:UDP-glucuronate decarboxylase